MGYIRHDLTVIGTFGDDVRVLSARVNKLRAELPAEWAALIVGPVVSIINGDVWWVMLPDGSKEGGDLSIQGEKIRRKFAALAPYRAVGLEWGDDEPSSWEGEYYPREDI